jgi:predicted flap endonuclease-1-like 5' DNA nuclease
MMKGIATMADKIADIKGLDEAHQAKLISVNITTTAELLAQAGTSALRTALSKQIDVDAKLITEWVNRADLMRLKGVGTEMANLLEEAGVDSCKELQHRVAANLHAKLKTVNDERNITHHAPTLAQVEAWVAEAAELSK